jgi:hypothetical protein
MKGPKLPKLVLNQNKKLHYDIKRGVKILVRNDKLIIILGTEFQNTKVNGRNMLKRYDKPVPQRI